MAVPETERRLPTALNFGEETITAEDLGQVAKLDLVVENDEGAPLDSDANYSSESPCVLISFLEGSVTVGQQNTYVVFVTDDALAGNVKKFRWNIYPATSTDPDTVKLPPKTRPHAKWKWCTILTEHVEGNNDQASHIYCRV